MQEYINGIPKNSNLLDGASNKTLKLKAKMSVEITTNLEKHKILTVKSNLKLLS